MNCTFWPVACSNRMPVTCPAAFWLTKVSLPGLAFIQATRPLRSSAGSVFLPIMSCGLVDTRPIGSKSFSRS
jgi:hypothetical protein